MEAIKPLSDISNITVILVLGCIHFLCFIQL